MQIGDSVKVIKLTGKYSVYLSRPRREGVIVGFPQKGAAIVAFIASKIHDSSCCLHPHTFYIKDLKVIKHNRNSQIGIRLDNLRKKYNIIREEDMK